MVAVALRMQTYRARRNAGRAMFNVEADEVGIARALVRMELLAQADEDNRAAVEKALERFLEIVVMEHAK